MNNYQIIFSPTGGTEKVANAITQTWSQVNTIDLSVPDINYKDIAHGNEDKINAMLPDNLPKDIQKLYNKAHK